MRYCLGGARRMSTLPTGRRTFHLRRVVGEVERGFKRLLTGICLRNLGLLAKQCSRGVPKHLVDVLGREASCVPVDSVGCWNWCWEVQPLHRSLTGVSVQVFERKMREERDEGRWRELERRRVRISSKRQVGRHHRDPLLNEVLDRDHLLVQVGLRIENLLYAPPLTPEVVRELSTRPESRVSGAEAQLLDGGLYTLAVPPVPRQRRVCRRIVRVESELLWEPTVERVREARGKTASGNVARF